MIQEKVISISGTRVITESGAKEPIGNANFIAGDHVWVDGNIVFGTQRKSQPTVMLSGGKAGENLIIVYAYVDTNSYINFAVMNLESGAVISNTITTIKNNVDDYGFIGFTINDTLKKFALIFQSNTDARLFRYYECNGITYTQKAINVGLPDTEYYQIWITKSYYEKNESGEYVLILKIYCHDDDDYSPQSGQEITKVWFKTYTDGELTDTNDLTSVQSGYAEQIYSLVHNSITAVISDTDTNLYADHYNLNSGSYDDFIPSEYADKWEVNTELFAASDFNVYTNYFENIYTQVKLINENKIMVVAYGICYVYSHGLEYAAVKGQNLMNIHNHSNCIKDKGTVQLCDYSKKGYVNSDLTKGWESYNEDGGGFSQAANHYLNDGSMLYYTTVGYAGSGMLIREITPHKYTYELSDQEKLDTGKKTNTLYVDIVERRKITVTNNMSDAYIENTIINTITLYGGLKIKGVIDTGGTTKGPCYYNENETIKIPMQESGNDNFYLNYGYYFLDGKIITNKLIVLLHEQKLEIYNNEENLRKQLCADKLVYNSILSIKKVGSEELGKISTLFNSNKDLPSS